MPTTTIEFTLSGLASWMKSFELQLRGIDQNLGWEGVLPKNATREQRLAKTREGLWRDVNWITARAVSAYGDFRNEPDEQVISGHRQFKQILAEIPTDLEDIFIHWRKFVEGAVNCLEDEMRIRGIGNLPDKQDDSELVREQTRKMIETITNLERDCEEEIRKNPSQADLINKLYRQAIDRIREQL